MRFMIVPIIALMSLSHVGLANAGSGVEAGNEIASLVTQWEGTAQRLRVSVCASRMLFLTSDAYSSTIVYGASQLFPVTEGTKVHVNRVSGSIREGFRFKYRDALRRSGDVWLRPSMGRTLRRTEIDSLLAVVFLRPEEVGGAPSLVGDPATRTVHAPWTNHLPAPSSRIKIESVDKAKDLAWKICPSCLHVQPRLSQYDIERQIGREAELRVRYQYPLSLDIELQRRVEESGRRVLLGWMAPLKGYQYSFTVIRSDALSAFACPGGAIFLTTAMVDAAGTDDELDAILAHEIAHVELRHGLREYISVSQSDALITALGVRFASEFSLRNASENGVFFASSIFAASQLAAKMVAAGYSRAYVYEADAIAAVYGERRGGDAEAAFIRVLKKLQFGEYVRGRTDQPTEFSTHPGMIERIARVEGALGASMDSAATFHGIDKDGEALVSVRFEYQVKYKYQTFRDSERPEERVKKASIVEVDPKVDAMMLSPTARPEEHDEYMVFATCGVSNTYRGTVRLDAISLVHREGAISLQNPEQARIGAGQTLGVVFTGKGPSKLIGGPITSIGLLTVPGVDRWVREP
jgi:Zn-dependent protease with chaperone function